MTCPYCGSKHDKKGRNTCGHPACQKRHNADMKAGARAGRATVEKRALRQLTKQRDYIGASVRSYMMDGESESTAIRKTALLFNEPAATVISIWKASK